MPTLTLTAATWAKQRPVQAVLLPDSEKAWLPAGEYPALAYGSETDGHVLVTLDPAGNDLGALHGSGRNTWWVYADHCTITGNLPDNNPADSAAKPSTLNGAIVLPGLGVRPLMAAVDGCQNFTWAEMTRNGSRPPQTATVTHNIIRVSKALEEVRSKLGDRSITITSGYRPPAVNKAIGGASQSRHVVGDAADIAVQGMRPVEVYQALNSWWGARGGLAYGRGFTHIDCRGLAARWTYPGV